MASRTLWKGAISFGLVHIPVGLHTAASEQGIDFDWLDKRSMDPVGYKRVNKRTGREIERENIVKGVEYEDGKYVLISPEEIEAVFPKSTQTIAIERFIDASEMPFIFLERPYYVAPVNKSDKVYALLREALIATGKIGLAKVVISTKQHLAALVPSGQVLVLNLLRWGGEIRSFEQLDLPPLDARAAGIKAAEMTMALALIKDMSQAWDADQFRNSFSEEIHQLVQAKAHAGDVQSVQRQQDAPAAPANAAVLDLTALLRSSLGKAGSGAPASAAKEKNTGAAAKAAKAAKAPATRTTPKPRKPASKAPAKRSTSK